MQVKQLKEYLKKLPVELDEFQIVYSETKKLTESGNIARLNIQIDNVVIDNENREMIVGTKDTIDLIIAESHSDTILVNQQALENLKPIPDGMLK